MGCAERRKRGKGRIQRVWPVRGDEKSYEVSPPQSQATGLAPITLLWRRGVHEEVAPPSVPILNTSA